MSCYKLLCVQQFEWKSLATKSDTSKHTIRSRLFHSTSGLYYYFGNYSLSVIYRRIKGQQAFHRGNIRASNNYGKLTGCPKRSTLIRSSDLEFKFLIQNIHGYTTKFNLFINMRYFSITSLP